LPADAAGVTTGQRLWFALCARGTFAAAPCARVGGINRKGIFTRIRTHRPAAHVLRELSVW
jgi:hypothetical protein